MKLRTSNMIGTIIGVAIMAAAVYFGIWLELGYWQECLADHSFWYCWRILS